jgi:hypothetical protein
MTNGLAEVLKRLHEELSEHPRLDTGTVESLKALATEIQLAIDSQAHGDESESSEDELTDERLSSRVQQAIEDFEAQHPQLTKTLSMIAERLADMGI